MLSMSLTGTRTARFECPSATELEGYQREAVCPWALPAIIGGTFPVAGLGWASRPGGICVKYRHRTTMYCKVQGR